MGLENTYRNEFICDP